MAAYRVDVDDQVTRTTEDLAISVWWRVHHQAWVFDAPDELGQRNLRFEACEWRAKTQVDAAAESEMLVVFTFEVHLVRIDKTVRITVG
jgi:hypothetical protein